MRYYSKLLLSISYNQNPFSSRLLYLTITKTLSLLYLLFYYCISVYFLKQNYFKHKLESIKWRNCRFWAYSQTMAQMIPTLNTNSFNKRKNQVISNEIRKVIIERVSSGESPTLVADIFKVKSNTVIKTKNTFLECWQTVKKVVL